MIHATGPLLSVDLDARETTTEEIDDALGDFVGGRGLATKLAFDRVPFDVDPLGPENRLYLSTGPLQHSRMSFTGRMNMTSVSPLTDGLASSNAGGFLSRNFTATGYAAVELRGAADTPLAVHIRDDGVEFEEVPDLAGAEVPAVSEWAAEAHDLDPEHLACIGPAGENLVRYACVMTSESRAFGRTGLGAVLGSKNVKVLTFDGDSEADVEIDPIQTDVHREAATSDHVMKRQGTTSVTEYANAVEALPTEYFARTSFEGAEGISGDAVESKKYRKGTCSQCAFACKLPTRDEEAGVETEGPEFETVMAWGSNQLVDDVVEVMKANDLCDRLGVDTISAGDTMAAYLKSEDDLANPERARELLRKAAYREGEVGDLLAEGVHRAAPELGVQDWSVKRLEFAAHDGRTLNGQGLSFATSNRGADHMYASFYSKEYPLVDKEQAVDKRGLDGKAPMVADAENHNAVLDSAVACKFSRDFMTEERLGSLLDADYDDLLAVGARVVELERAFNNRRGFDRADDALPYDIEGFEEALDEYYDARGWREDGVVPGLGEADAGVDAASADD
ncbi:aldehyde ferredoxin oxidoreductase family protein [Halobaculum roseum]|uniref:Aldehyde ferredoxin oxidoreductase family protein n=1 Tax=Halobaculum roseum TaxID=2175149 RepID=A0ABD5MMS3_9EURY|nr:aldehyde ferredoxin oxidoreductase C-terminal domain-containing protein [Halobaculum roseum]QZY01486.1 aldehyde ferredoxin oxidoreductase [Halobaculum roseum]